MLGPALATFALTRIPKTDNARMETRNGLSSLISESFNDFALNLCRLKYAAVELELPAASKSKVNSGFVVRQLLSGSLVPYRASSITLHRTGTGQQRRVADSLRDRRPRWVSSGGKSAAR